LHEEACAFLVTCNRKGHIALPAKNKIKSSPDKVRAHRKRLRQQGLRPIQIWVPDLRSPAFASEAHRQSFAVGHSSHADDDQAFIDAITTEGDAT
jgi:hypothetical protein